MGHGFWVAFIWSFCVFSAAQWMDTDDDGSMEGCKGPALGVIHRWNALSIPEPVWSPLRLATEAASTLTGTFSQLRTAGQPFVHPLAFLS